jgi:hypothetical protein
MLVRVPENTGILAESTEFRRSREHEKGGSCFNMNRFKSAKTAAKPAFLSVLASSVKDTNAVFGQKKQMKFPEFCLD